MDHLIDDHLKIYYVAKSKIHVRVFSMVEVQHPISTF